MPTIFEQPSNQGEKVTGSNSGQNEKPPAGQKMLPLTSFAMRPDGIRFETQEEEEVIILFLRQHLIVTAPWFLLGILLVLAPPVIIPFLFRNVILSIALPWGYMIVGIVFWYLATFGFLLNNFLRWFFNIYIVTNQRIIDIDFVHLLQKEFSEARLTNIQDITYSATGLLSTIFDYGNVFIQTAGEFPNFEFISVPHPEKVIKIISEAAHNLKERKI